MVISMFASLMLVNSNGGGWYFHGNTEGILGSDADDPDPWCGSDELKCYEKHRDGGRKLLREAMHLALNLDSISKDGELDVHFVLDSSVDKELGERPHESGMG